MKVFKLIAAIPWLLLLYILLVFIWVATLYHEFPKYGVTPDPISTFPSWFHKSNMNVLLVLGVILFISPVLFLYLAVKNWFTEKKSVLFWSGIYFIGIIGLVMLRETSFFEWLLD